MNEEIAAQHNARMATDIAYATGYRNGLAEAQRLLEIAEGSEDSSKDVLDVFSQHLAAAADNPNDLISYQLDE